MGAVNKESSFNPSEPLIRPNLYELDALNSLEVYHRNIASNFGVINPYFNFTDAGHNLVMFKQLENGITLKVGPIGAFTSAEIATLIHEQTCSYIIQGTMGRNFPKDNNSSIEELLSAMMGQFNSSRVIAVFEKKTSKGVKPLVGVQAVFGTTDADLLQIMLNNFIVGNQDKVTPSLSTVSSLRFDKITQTEVDFLSEHGGLMENQIVCLSRLFSLEKERWDDLKVDLRGYPWIVMAALAIGIDGVAKMFSDSVEYPQICLYDTHTQGIQAKLERYFGMMLIVAAGEVQPTEAVLQSIYRFHYLPKEKGGFIEDIMIGFVGLEEYIKKSRQLLLKKGITINEKT